MKGPLQDALKTGLTLNQVRRVLLTLERRFNESWPIKATELATQPWADVRNQITGLINGTLQRRTERLFGQDGEIVRDLEANREFLTRGLEDEGTRLALLQMLTLGKRVSFDSRSHRRQLRTQNRLTYVFSMAGILVKMSVSESTGRILTHLKGAEKVLQQVLGFADFEHLKQNSFTLGALPVETRDTLASSLGDTGFATLKETPLAEINEEDAAKIREVLGDKQIVKVSLVGVGMRSHAGIASRMFGALAREGINIEMISTSEIKVSVVIDEKYLELAVRALHTEFGLDAAA